MTVSKETEDWVFGCASRYEDPARIFTDTMQLLRAMPEFTPQEKPGADGVALLVLEGTLASGARDVPVEFWLPFDYPAHEPRVYVRPAGSARLVPSRIVDQTGRCSIDWKHQSLVRLARSLAEQFSAMPPIVCSGPPGNPFAAPSKDSYSISAPRHAEQDLSTRQPVDIMNLNIAPAAANESDARSQPVQLKRALDAAIRQMMMSEVEPDTKALVHTSEVLAYLEEAVATEQRNVEHARQQHLMQQRLLAGRTAAAREVIAVTRKQASVLESGELERQVVPASERDERLAAATADDMSISDTIAALARALDSGCLNLNDFLRKTRDLAREQFYSRAARLQISTE